MGSLNRWDVSWSCWRVVISVHHNGELLENKASREKSRAETWRNVLKTLNSWIQLYLKLRSPELFSS